MPSADAALADMVRRIRLSGKIAKEAADECARAFEAQLKAELVAGHAPDGSAWEPTKAGGRPLAHAADHVTVVAVGTTLLGRLEGHDVFHHYGTKKDPRRPILPTGAIPDSIAAAIKQGLVNWWDREVAGV